MYPFRRFLLALRDARRAGPLSITGTHVSQHVCWPWDLDVFAELNNGRTLTLYDLGRFAFGRRTGLLAMLKRESWGLTVAGSSTRYRRRVRMFDRFEMRTRMVGWDDRFLYLEQSMWRSDDCTSHILIRAAVTDQDGIVSIARILAAWGAPVTAPALPDWVIAWTEAEARRPWPPMQDPPADAEGKSSSKQRAA